MKIFIKIALLVLVAGGIAAAIYFFTKKGPDTGQVDELSLTPFEEFVGMMGSSEEQQYVKAMSKVQVLARMPWQLFIY